MGATGDQLPLVKGTLDALVLKALSWGTMHGFEITTWVEERSGGRLGVEDSALYHALVRLEERGHIDAHWGMTENNRRARYYRLTPAGRRQLHQESTRWEQIVAAIARVMEPAERS